MKVLDAARYMLSRAWGIDRRKLATGAVLLGLGYLAGPAVGVALGAFTEAALDADTSRAVGIAVALGVLIMLELMGGHFAHLSYFEVADLLQLRITEEVAYVTHAGTDLSRLDDPAFVKRLTTVTEGLRGTRAALEGTLQLSGMMIQVTITTVILAFVEPWLLLLPLAAIPPVWLSQRAQRLLDDARDDAAPDIRRTRHLVRVATTPETAKEIRLFGAVDVLRDRQRAAWQHTTRVLWSAHRRSAALRAAGQVWFALAYGGALFVVVRSAAAGTATVGEVVLVITLAVQVSVQVSAALALLGSLQGTARMVQHLRALFAEVETPAPGSAPVPAPVPARLETGIRLENVTFGYPGAERPVLDSVSLDLPAGATIALVGDNGAGKSTLVKLLCGLYQPTSGRITVDGADLAGYDDWFEHVATLFQDFARFELRVRENVGVGKVEHLDDDDALWAAIDAARARPIVEGRAAGLDRVLGSGYADGDDLSGGQWQTLGLARTLMRPDPLLLVLDEPASALDATAEHALFERFRDSADRARQEAGGITLFVSHRFSTVRDADLILVLDGGSIREHGTHDELIAADGLYAELYGLQAASYT